MSIKDDADEAWDNYANGPAGKDFIEPDFDTYRLAFLAGYEAACVDINSQLAEPVPRQYGRKVYPARKSQFDHEVYVDSNYLTELRLHAGEEDL